MSNVLLKRFTFDTASHWDTTGDATVASALATLSSPITQLPWASAWSSAPSENGESDAILTPAQGATYGYTHAGAYGDFTLVYTVCHVGAMGAGEWLYALLRYDITGPTALHSRLDGEAGGGMSGTLQNFDTPAVVYAKDSEFGDSFPSGTWRTVRIRLSGQTVEFEVVGVRALHYTGFDAANAGTFAILASTSLADGQWLSGSTGAHAQPYFAVPHTGTVKLAAVRAYSIPLTVASLGTLTCVHDFTNDPSGMNYKRVVPCYNLYHAGAWSGWTDVADGDMSGVSVAGGDLVLVGVTLDNTVEHTTWPGISALDLTINCQSIEEVADMTDVLNAIKDALDADATITALAGWDPSGCVICDADSIGAIRMQAQATCYVARGTTTPEYQGTGKTGSVEVTPAMIWYEVHVVPAVQYPVADPSNVLVGDDALEELTKAVWSALKMTTLSSTVKWLELGTVEPVKLDGYDENIYVRANRITVRAMAGYELL